MVTLQNNIIILNIKKKKSNDFLEIIKKYKIPYPIKQNYNIIIPPNIFQTWHTNILPPLMNNAINKIRLLNPNFNYQLFDDNDCREFIKQNYDISVLNAYDQLIPGAYKADLWRYCILYKFGGIYLDIKYIPINGFKFINLLEKEHWVLDIDKNGIYNALMVCKPGNQILLKAITQIVENVKNKYYGYSSLDPTGPRLLSIYFSKEEKKNFDMHHELYNSFNNRFILYNNYYILKSYNGYLDEHDKNKKNPHYSQLWEYKNIYK